jgi:hypothetical protein
MKIKLLLTLNNEFLWFMKEPRELKNSDLIYVEVDSYILNQHFIEFRNVYLVTSHPTRRTTRDFDGLFDENTLAKLILRYPNFLDMKFH